MKHLYVIGNGFDIFTGLKTRYVEFRWWLEHKYPFVFEDMQAAYDIEGEWWNDFEVQLGKLNVKKYVKKYLPPEPSLVGIMKRIEKRKAFEEKYKLPPSLHHDSHCARRLRGLLDILQYCFEKWVENAQKMITNAKYINIETEDSFFINFNYTDVIELLYKVPDERVLHIHGRASKHERLVFGHGDHLFGDMATSQDEEQTMFELNRYNKNPYEYIPNELSKVLKDVEFVHIYGFSFSPVDVDYIDWILKQTPKTSRWEVSWFSEEDERRIDRFLLDHYNLKDRLSKMRLEAIQNVDGSHSTGSPKCADALV